MGWRDGQGGGMMQPQSSLSGFRGGANPLAGTGGVRSPSGPYGPPGFLGGPQNTGGPGGMYAGGPGGTIMNQSLPTGGAEPYNAGSSTTGGPSYAVNPGPAPYGGMGSPAPTNELPPQLAGTGGVRSPYGPYGPPGFIGGGNDRLSPAQSAQWQAAVGNSPWRGLMPNQGQYPTGHGNGPGPVHGGGPREGPAGGWAAELGVTGKNDPRFRDRYDPGGIMAGAPRTWTEQELAKAGVNWQGMNQMQQMRAWLNTLPPEKAADYLAKYAALGPNAGSLTIGGWQPGMDPMMSVGPVGSGPFGNGIAS